MNQLHQLIPFIRRHQIGGFIFSGGDTARWVCEKLEIQSMALERELLTGLPWGHLLGGAADGVPVCTKAGGFGTADALVVCTDFLSQHRHDQAVFCVS